MEYPLVSTDPAVQAHYERSRRAGSGHKLALMFAWGQPPMANTDREFLEGWCNGSQFSGDPAAGDFYKGEATRAGVDTTGKVYLSALAAFPGDPEAWVSGRGDVQRVCEKRGWSCEGAVTVKPRPPAEPPAPAPAVADDIVDDLAAEAVAADPALARLPAAEVRAEVRGRHGPHWGAP